MHVGELQTLELDRYVSSVLKMRLTAKATTITKATNNTAIVTKRSFSSRVLKRLIYIFLSITI